MMYQLPEIKPRKKPKPAYRKPEAVKELERMADDEARRLHPSIDPRYLAPRQFSDKTANHLTAAIVKYITLKGGFASRLNTTGVYDQRTGRYRKGTQKRGLGDIIATYQGRSIQIEVKIGRDKMSEHQERVQQEQQQAGGLYYVARNFSDFKAWFDGLVHAGLQRQEITGRLTDNRI